MIIKQAQLKHLEAIALKAFIKKTTEMMILEFPNWKSSETYVIKESYVHNVVAYGQKCNIRASSSLIRLVEYTIRYNKATPLSEEFEMNLKRGDMDEDVRLENFYLQLNRSRNHLISIEIKD